MQKVNFADGKVKRLNLKSFKHNPVVVDNVFGRCLKVNSIVVKKGNVYADIMDDKKEYGDNTCLSAMFIYKNVIEKNGIKTYENVELLAISLNFNFLKEVK